MFGHRQQSSNQGVTPSNVPNHFLELLETLKGEYEALQQEMMHIKMQKEDFDAKCNALVMHEH